VRQQRLPAAARFLLAIIFTMAMVALRWWLDRWLGAHLALVTLFAAVALSVWVGGWAPALLAAILGYLACDFLFIEPRGTLGHVDVRNLVGAGAYLLTCIVIIAFGEAVRGARAQASARSESLRVTLASIGDAVITTDTQGCVTFLNAVAEKLTGWPSGEAVGRTLDEVFRIVCEATRDSVENPALRALRDGTISGLANHTILIARDGSERPIDDSAAPIRDEQGEVAGCVLIFRDISERRAAENAVQRSHEAQARLAAIVSASDDAILSKTLDGVIQSWNAGAERLYGYTSDEAVGQSINLIIPPELQQKEQSILESLRNGERLQHYETIRVAKDGRRLNVSLSVSPVRDASGRIVGASKVARDITAKTKTEGQLRESEERFRTIADSAPLLMWLNDLSGCVFVNRAYLDFLGLHSQTEVRGYDWTVFVHPEDREAYIAAYQQSMRTASPFAAEFRFLRHDGEYRWMQSTGVARLGANGELIGYTGCTYDIHEARLAAESLREADRRKDEFLATLAHELRNPLAPLVNMLEILKRADGSPELLQQVRSTMARQLNSLVRLVDDLLDLSRITRNRLVLRRQRVDLASVIQHAIETCGPLFEDLQHEFKVSLPANPVLLHADPVRLAQVFHNLLHNACKYTPRKGRISLTAEQDGPEIVVKISDTGIGIPPEKLSTIFEMFSQVDQSLERAHGGLGIGLTLVKRLVELHGGTVQAFSHGKGQGSEFVVRLAALNDSAEVEGPVEPGVGKRATARRVLIVDDNEDSARSLAMLLDLSGDRTRTAHDGIEALAAAEEFRPEVVLLDIGMPKLNGFDAARRIRQQPWGKDMVLIALTGWGQDADRRRSQQAGFDAHLVKPIDHAVLEKVLSSLPGRRGADPPNPG
jgi:PAS domain S-box-containing protein